MRSFYCHVRAYIGIVFLFLASLCVNLMNRLRNHIIKNFFKQLPCQDRTYFSHSMKKDLVHITRHQKVMMKASIVINLSVFPKHKRITYMVTSLPLHKK